MMGENIKSGVLNLIKKSTIESLKHNANTTTCVGVYQPKAPKQLSQISKIKNDK